MRTSALTFFALGALATSSVFATDENHLEVINKAAYQTEQYKDEENDTNICMWEMGFNEDTRFKASLVKIGRINTGSENYNKSQVWVAGLAPDADTPVFIESAWLEVKSLFQPGKVWNTNEIALNKTAGERYIISLPEKDFHIMMLNIGVNGYTLHVQEKDSDETISHTFNPPQSDDEVLTYRECLSTIPKINEVIVEEKAD